MRSRTATAVASAVNFARDLVNVPPNDLYPESFADELKSRGKGTKVSVAVTDEKALEDKGYGGILGVGKGSVRPPRLVKLSYKPVQAGGAHRARRQGHHVRLRRSVDQAEPTRWSR